MNFGILLKGKSKIKDTFTDLFYKDQFLVQA